MQKCSVCTLVATLCLTPLFVSSVSWARPDSSVKFATIREENPNEAKNTLVLPYAFPSDSLGTVFGVGGMTRGYGQDQLLLGATGLVGTDDAYIGFLGMWDLRILNSERFFLSVLGSLGEYPAQRAYVNVPRPQGEVYAGSNDSDKDDYFSDSGSDNWLDFKLEYVLPIGNSAATAMQRYKLKDGILQSGASGGETWNPMAGGVTSIMLKQYNRYQSMKLDPPLGKKDYTVHPLRFSLYYNNTDFYTNPSTGSSQYLAYTRDFAWMESETEWDFMEFEYSKYFDFGTNEYARQQVLALNFWTGFSPSATTYTDANGDRRVSDAPPFTQGAVLGGLYRMRAFPSYRFNDHAVLYGTAEYRWTLDWNPIGAVNWLRWLKMDWMQLVPFVEVGRVAEDYDLGELMSDMKVDGGLSLRAMLSGAVVRFDMTYAEEESAAWVMFGHPF